MNTKEKFCLRRCWLGEGKDVRPLFTPINVLPTYNSSVLVFHIPCSDTHPKLPSQSLGRTYALSRASLAFHAHCTFAPPRGEGTYVLFSGPLKGASQVLLSPMLIHSCCWLVGLGVESPPRWWTSRATTLSSFPSSSPSNFFVDPSPCSIRPCC